MKSEKTFGVKLRKISTIVLIVLLVMGILCTSFGVGVLALSPVSTLVEAQNEQTAQDGENTENNDNVANNYPTNDYSYITNEATLSEDVTVLSEQDSALFNSTIKKVEREDGIDDPEMVITLSGKEHKEFDDISRGDIVYIHGDETTCFGGDRIFKIDNKWTSGNETKFRVIEPYFDEVFDNFSYCASDALTKDNLVGAQFAEGVTAYFGDIDDSKFELQQTGTGTGTLSAQGVQALSQSAQAEKTAVNYSTQGNDIIVKFDVGYFDSDEKAEDKNDKNNDKDNDKDDKDKSPVQTTLGLKGEFGLRDLRAHTIFDMPSFGNIKEAYIGASGSWVCDIDLYGKLELDSEYDTGERDYKLATISGLAEKRALYAVFEFKGTTPILLTDPAFDARKEQIVPSIFLAIYADWEGKVSFEVNAGFEASSGFNSGLSLVKNGEFNGKIESFPYQNAMQEKPEKEMKWDFAATLEADTEFTAFGTSLIFYVGGINLGDIAVAKIGTQAKGKVSITADSVNGWTLPNKDNTDFYLRFFAKLLDIKIRLSVDGKSIFDGVDVEIDESFTFLDLTLFEFGVRPDKYKNKAPVSSMVVPDEFTSALTLVCDVSGSMNEYIDTGETKLYAAQQAAKMVVETTSRWAEYYEENYGIGVVQFSDDSKNIALPHIDYRYLKDCIDIIRDGGGTNITAGINSGVDQLVGIKSDSKVIILMTDGQDSATNSIREAAHNAADNGIKIFTIGFGEDVNEEILSEIADITGGEYRFASTENIVSIMGTFIYAHQSANAEVITDFEGTVSEGETTEKTTFEIEDDNGDLIITTAWPGSFLDTILVDPKGRVVDENYPDAITDESSIPATITVKNPLKGKWSIKIKGVETSYENEPYYTIVAFKEGSAKAAKLNTEMSALQNISAYLIPVGVMTTVVSAMLLYCINKKPRVKKTDTQETE